MPNRKRRSHFTLALVLVLALCVGMFSPRMEGVEAKPAGAFDELGIFISEFRTRGPNGADDEFVEIFNASGMTIATTSWKLMKSSGCGSTLSDLVTNINITLLPGQYYLFTRSGAGNYSGSTSTDATFSSTIADDGGIALTDSTGNIKYDQVGMCLTTSYKENNTLSPLSNSVEQSYERKTSGIVGSCKDTDNNFADFQLNSSSSNPQNFLSPLFPCLAVTNVSSTKTNTPPNSPYTFGEVIDIDVSFSNNVNVTGNPTLTIETGAVDQIALYLSGSGSSVLAFRYTVTSTDSSLDLDYASSTALSLNGGTIIGAVGNASLVLPKPGSAGSLALNKAIQIDAVGNPSIVSFKRQDPISTSTNADALKFRVTFSEAVTGLNASDFSMVGTLQAPTVQLVPGNGSVYDVQVSGGDLINANTTIGLNFSVGANPQDVNGNFAPVIEPSVDESYTLDNTAPTVTIAQAPTQTDPATSQPVFFIVSFNEPIDTSTFTISDISQSGSTATGISWTITDSGDHTNFTLAATATDNNGLIILSLPAGRVADLAGNLNQTSLPADNSVLLDDSIPPTVTINQAAGQLDPTSALPINFTVQFSESINPAVFTTSDITQNGTATGVVWNIVNSGDNKTFTLSATSSGYGTVVPSIAANRVTDLSGNNNTASTATDNSVEFVASSAHSVIINEVAWAGTTSSLTDDEWIELYNTTNASINITGWTLKAADGTPTITLNGTIPANGYFLLERDDDNAVSDIPADQVYTGELSNSGETLTLLDGANKVIDTANGNGGAWPKGSSSTYETMERVGTSTESDSSWFTNTSTKRNGKNANGGNILGTPKQSNSQALSPTLTPTPTPIPTSTPIPPTIAVDPRPIINEIHARPGFDWNQDGNADVFDEFIEIKNLTSVSISLNGWKLDTVNGRKSFSLPDATLKPGERVVFYSKETNLLLSDGGETVRLSNSGGKIYDAFTYELARAEDASFCRLPDGNPGNSWFEDCIPTPKLANTREGQSPVSPNGSASPVCNLPDTIPLDFFIPECNGYGAAVWDPYYWDQLSGFFRKWIQDSAGKWDTFIE